MRTQTKCTLSLCGLFIIEILPIPFTAIYSLYVVRKRPMWLPEVVNRLYADKPGDDMGGAVTAGLLFTQTDGLWCLRGPLGTGDWYIRGCGCLHRLLSQRQMETEDGLAGYHQD